LQKQARLSSSTPTLRRFYLKPLITKHLSGRETLRLSSLPKISSCSLQDLSPVIGNHPMGGYQMPRKKKQGTGWDIHGQIS
jgi:hypothetical protein